MRRPRVTPRRGRLTRERKTVAAMITLYCRDHHRPGKSLCDDCAALHNYAMKRLDNCRFADDKPVCSQCTVHCYKPLMRERIRAVMRYAGPRMMRRHPLLAIAHLADRMGEGGDASNETD